MSSCEEPFGDESGDLLAQIRKSDERSSARPPAGNTLRMDIVVSISPGPVFK
jgi:hypothetical protein